MDFNYRMIDDGSNCITSYKGNVEHVIIPDNLHVTVLFDDLFKGHPEIISVKIPDTVTDIGGFVFDGCINLKELILPPDLINMWQYSLTRSGITAITVPGTVKSIVPFTFQQCKNLEEVRFCEGTEKICAWAFKDCISLKNIYLPVTLKDISDQAFAGCNNVKITYL
jgi:hypothetical protein